MEWSTDSMIFQSRSSDSCSTFVVTFSPDAAMAAAAAALSSQDRTGTLPG